MKKSLFQNLLLSLDLHAVFILVTKTLTEPIPNEKSPASPWSRRSTHWNAHSEASANDLTWEQRGCVARVKARLCGQTGFLLGDSIPNLHKALSQAPLGAPQRTPTCWRVPIVSQGLPGVLLRAHLSLPWCSGRTVSSFGRQWSFDVENEHP